MSFLAQNIQNLIIIYEHALEGRPGGKFVVNYLIAVINSNINDYNNKAGSTR